VKSFEKHFRTKIDCKILVKLNTVFNFANILQAAFAPKLFNQKITKPNYKWRKAAQNTFT